MISSKFIHDVEHTVGKTMSLFTAIVVVKIRAQTTTVVVVEVVTKTTTTVVVVEVTS